MNLKKSNESLLSDINRLVDEVVSIEELKQILDSGKRLTIKYGVDCTAPFMHLGHAVNLWVMRRFQENGHKVVFLIGDFTSLIGDPTGKSQTRKVLTKKEIEESAIEFIKQVSTVLITDNPNVFEIRRNSEWFDKMPLSNFISLCSLTTHSQMISRDMFKKRIQSNADIHMNELLYPILQGFDSVMLNSDLTVVGTDQLFNEMMGRFFQKKIGNKQQVVMTTKITKGLWGDEKQSKSVGNFVALNDSSKDKFGKIMTLNDERIIEWMKVYTDIKLDKVEEFKIQMENNSLNPRDVKLLLAHAIVEKYHGIKIADVEKEFFVNTFSNKIFPSDIPTIKVEKNLNNIDLISICCPELSKSEIKRLISQNAVKLNNEIVSDAYAMVNMLSENTLKIGKRKFFNVIM